MPRCPVCRCERFYVQDPADAFETHCFEVTAGRAHFTDAVADAPDLAVTAGTEVFCDQCSWHGPGQHLGIDA